MVCSFIVTLLTQSLIYLDQIHLFKLPDIGVGYSRLFPVWIFYFILGYYFRKRQHWIISSISKAPSFIFLGFITSFFILLMDSILTNTYDTSMKPTVIMYAIFSFFAFYLLGEIKYPLLLYKYRVALKWLSEHSFFVFLVHPAILLIINHITKNMGNGYFGGSNLGIFLTYIAVTIISYLVSFFISFIALAPLLGGVYNVKRKSVTPDENNKVNHSSFCL